VLAAARVGAARVTGAEVGSRELLFEPGALVAEHHAFDVGTAGSATLVLQTILPPLLVADAPSRIEIVGGTHNPLAPPFDFLERAFVPALRTIGADVSVEIERPGFYPAGGGKIACDVRPRPLGRLELVERGALRRVTARALISKLPHHVAERELETVRREIDLDAATIVEVDAFGPGNAIVIDVEHEAVAEVFAEIGQRGIRAETVAERAARPTREYLDARVAVGPHLADQLLLPMAMGAGGVFSTLEPTLHTRTNAALISRLLPVSVEIGQEGSEYRVRVAPSAG
jgi:RNA 3'-terminal phosphate cyclase (ATP)